MLSVRALPFALLLSLGIVGWKQSQVEFPPTPRPFVGVALVFTILALVALASPELAAAFAVAIVIWLALAYGGGLSKPGDQVQQPQFNQGGGV